MPGKLAFALPLALVLAACGATQSSRHAAVPATPVAETTRVVGTRGIELAVPAGWRLNKGACGRPQENTVLWNEGIMLDCLVGQPRGISAVEFGGIPATKHGTPATIGGVSVLRLGSTRFAGTTAVRLYLPHRGIGVTVLSPNRALVRRIVASLHAVRVDHNGCSVRTPSGGYRLGSQPAPGRRLVPPGAVRVVACSYGARWVDRSNRLGRTGAARLARALNTAPFGFSHPPAANYLPSICAPSWHGSRIVAHFEYGNRPPVVVTSHIDGCSRLGASNGRWAVQMKKPWVYRLVTVSHYGSSFPDLNSVR